MAYTELNTSTETAEITALNYILKFKRTDFPSPNQQMLCVYINRNKSYFKICDFNKIKHLNQYTHIDILKYIHFT